MKKISICFTLLFLLSGAAFTQDAEAYFKQAEVKSSIADYQAAVDLYSKVIQADPEYINAYLRRAFCYSILKEYEKCISDYTKVIEQNPQHTMAYLSRGSAYNKLEKYDKAIADFNQVLELDPKDQEAYNNRGWAKKAKGDKEGACDDWTKSKRLGNAEAKLILKNNHCK
ncbi:MAG: tetratricopeptide repeat protein [Bacteroidia bacterium]|nr:tetratricopeptide repeat protein [Bacteroidia bacterium]